MINNLFGEMEYSIGWKCKKEISIFGKVYSITVKIQARKPDQDLPSIQEQTCLRYIEHEKEYLCDIEKMMVEYCDTVETRFTPRTLLFKRNGACALLFDDVEEPDEGIAACIIPDKHIVSQDMFL